MPLWYRDPSGLQPGADVMASSTIWPAVVAAVAAVAPYVPPLAVAAGGAAAIYGASQAGTYTANHPSNPFVNVPWPMNPFKAAIRLSRTGLSNADYSNAGLSAVLPT